MNTSDDRLNAFASMARAFLASNVKLLDSLVAMLHSIAEELDSLKNTHAISNGKYIAPYKFKQEVLKKIMRKFGYTLQDISDLCNQGRAEELLHEIDGLEKSTLASSSQPSRRALPIMKFEDITGTSSRSSPK